MNARDKLNRIIGNFGVLFPGNNDVKRIIGSEKIAISQKCDDECCEDGGTIVEAENLYDRSLEQQTFKRLVSTEKLKQVNINSVINEAKEELSVDEQADDKNIDTGWLLRFMDMAGNISDKDLQIIWGKLLAGKVRDTSKISLHSLVTIANLSRECASLFNGISQYIVNFNGINVLLNDSDFNEKHGIIFYDILRINEYGLVDSSGTLSMNAELSNVPRFPVKYGKYVNYGYAVKKIKINLQVFTLTEAGNDLLSIIDVDYDKKFFNDVKEFVMKKYSGVGFVE